MLGRQVTAALRRPLQARLRSIAAPPTQSSLCIRTFSYAPRLLTPAGRPKKAVGEPSRPVKRAVKAKAKEPASTKTDAAAKKIAEKEKAAKKKAAEKEKKKKAAAAKKEKPALTPEQVERKTAALQKAEIKDLKKAALEPPAKNGVRNAWLAFSKEKGNELRERIASESESDGARTAEGRTSHETIRAQLAAHSKNIAAAWKDVTPAEREHYNHIVHTSNEAADAEYKRWVESHDVNEIRIANLARRKLRRSSDAKDAKKWPAIKDERHVKRAVTSYLQFSISRQASGDFTHIKVHERAKLLSQEWKALSDEEKQKYKNLAARDSERQSSEESSVYSSA